MRIGLGNITKPLPFGEGEDEFKLHVRPGRTWSGWR